MRRKIEDNLLEWQKVKHPKPLILRGARQVGKSYIVSKFARANFENFININFEELGSVKNYFDEDLDPELIIKKLNLKFKTTITTGKTLIFFDEIQACPRALQSLRFFYEKIPGLHIIAAGSLLEFALKSGEISMPVGRIQYLFLRPLSFDEYLMATDNHNAINYINELSLQSCMDSDIHEELLKEFRIYSLLGGMPAVLQKYLDTQDWFLATQEQEDIINTYRDDFSKYAKERQLRFLDLIIQNIPRLLGEKFKYSKIDRDIRSEYLKEAIWLLEKSQLIHKINRSSGQAIPLGSLASEKDFKLILLDAGLSYKMLNLNEEIIEMDNIHNIAAGALAEQIVGQELMAYQTLTSQAQLYYWEKDGQENSAEVDYMHVRKGRVYGIEVKAGATGKLKSLYQFMKKYKSPLGIRISQLPLGLDKGVISVPFYAIRLLDRFVDEGLELL